MIASWVLVLVASVVTIGALLGSARTTDQAMRSDPDSKQAAALMMASFPHQDGADEFVVVHSTSLTAEDPGFEEFVTDVRSAIEGTGATLAVSEPYAADNTTGISQDQHAVLLAVSM